MHNQFNSEMLSLPLMVRLSITAQSLTCHDSILCSSGLDSTRLDSFNSRKMTAYMYNESAEMLTAWTFTNQHMARASRQQPTPIANTWKIQGQIMNIQVRTLALHVLLSPHICFSLPHETNEPMTSTKHPTHPLTPFSRDLNGDSEAFSDDTPYFSNDETTSTIVDDANPRDAEEDHSVNVVEYLCRPNTLESLANSINTILTIPAIYNNDASINDKNQERQDATVQVLNESVDLVSFFGFSDAKAFPVFSFNYDTMPPTTNKQTESPAPTPELSSTITASTSSVEPTDDPAPTVAMVADDDLGLLHIST